MKSYHYPMLCLFIVLAPHMPMGPLMHVMVALMVLHVIVDRLLNHFSPDISSGFVIAHSDGLRWRTLDGMGCPDWTFDINDALCFSRRYHADIFAQDDPEDVRIKRK